MGGALETVSRSGLPFEGRAALEALTRLLTTHVAGPVITPPTITAATNDYDPQGFTSCAIVRAACNPASNITGFAAPAQDTRLVLFINTGANNFTLVHASASSEAKNRILCPGSANVTVQAEGCVWLLYDATSTRWRVI